MGAQDLRHVGGEAHVPSSVEGAGLGRQTDPMDGAGSDAPARGRRPDWAALYRRHREAMMNAVARRLLLAGRDAHEAEDIVHRVFVEVMARSPDVIRTWEAFLIHAALQRTRDHLNSAEIRRAFPGGLSPGEEDSGDRPGAPSGGDVEASALAELQEENIRHAVREVLAALPDRQRRVLRLRLFEGRTNMEIAPQLGVTPQRVSQLFKKAHATLKARLRADPTIGLDEEGGATDG